MNKDQEEFVHLALWDEEFENHTMDGLIFAAVSTVGGMLAGAILPGFFGAVVPNGPGAILGMIFGAILALWACEPDGYIHFRRECFRKGKCRKPKN